MSGGLGRLVRTLLLRSKRRLWGGAGLGYTGGVMEFSTERRLFGWNMRLLRG